MPHIMEANKKQEIDILPKNWNHLFFEDNGCIHVKKPVEITTDF